MSFSTVQNGLLACLLVCFGLVLFVCLFVSVAGIFQAPKQTSAAVAGMF